MLFILALSCKDGGTTDTASSETDPTCDTLDESLCALPFPSSFYLAAADTESGFQVALQETSLPENRDGVQIKPTWFNEKDGFSTMTPMLAYFEDVSLDGVVRSTDIGDSLLDDSLSVLINVDTGERVPHWVELDDTGEVGEQLLVIRPAIPMDHAARHVVALRGLTTTSGSALAPSAAMQDLIDGASSVDTPTGPRQAHYDDLVFPVLGSAGWERDEVLLAWDFVTVSRTSSLSRMEWIRDDVHDWGEENGWTYTIDSVEGGDCTVEGETNGRAIEGTFTAPLYTDYDDAPTFLTRDEDGMPYRNGTTEVEFKIQLGCQLLDDPKPSYFLQYGHGLLGKHDEVGYGWSREFLDNVGFVGGAVSWTGMKDEDEGPITLMVVNDPSDFAMIPERSHQGFAEQIGFLDFVRSTLVNDPELIVDGVHLIDTEQFGYYGNSQGGILGAAYLGLSDQLERGVLGVPGGPYALLLTRSADFDPFFLLFKEKFPDDRDIMLLIAAFQTVWDPGEGAGWMHNMNAAPNGTPAKDVLLHAAIGDAQVTTLGAQIMARAYGATTVAPQTREVWGIEEREPGYSGSALVEWLYPDGAEEPLEAVPPDEEADTHECPRRENAAHQQIHDFLVDGVVNQYCEGESCGSGTRSEVGCD